jgi:hypothetical protein
LLVGKAMPDFSLWTAEVSSRRGETGREMALSTITFLAKGVTI